MTDAYVARQLDLEQEMFRSSAEKLQADIAKAKRGDREDETAYASRLMIAKIEAVAEGVREMIQNYGASARPGRPSVALKFLLHLEPEVAAALALKGVLAGVTKKRTAQRCAIHIGRTVEDELLWRTFEAQAPEESAITEKKLSRVSSYRHRKRVVSVMAGRAGIARVEMTESERLHVGHTLLEIVVERTGLVELQNAALGSASAKEMVYVVPAFETLKWIERFTGWYAAVSPEWWPTVIPPKPWDGPNNGGYYTRCPRPLPLVKSARKAFLMELANVDMPGVYAAINAVQETAYVIDEAVLRVMEHVWANAVSVAKVPAREPQELPAKPEDIDTNEEARNEWKKKAAKTYDGNVRLLSRRLQFDQGLKMARRFAAEPSIYMPHQLDFRGRMYAIPLLSYQGPDWMKGLLRFANGKAIENVEQAGYLMIQGANLWGCDKGSLDERMEWVEQNEAQIRAAAADPLASYWWADADSPWQFLQWCREWAAFTAQGYGYVSSFICSADGTCNGLQHFSAMLRDPVGGAATNLVPSDRPSDIYAKVAEVVTAKLCLIVAGSGIIPKEVDGRAGRQWAEKWLEFGVTRKDTKRSVMVLPYGGTQYSTREFIEDAVRERISGGHVNPFPCRVKSKDGQVADTDGIFKASLFLAPLVWEAIGEVVVAARDAMAWLKGTAKVIAKEGLPVTWQTNDGFPVRQAYYQTKMVQVRMKMAGQACKLVIREELPELDKRRQEQGISPNFVHSCDGAALRQYVVYGKASGISSFAVVHDSFGCVAADYLTMSACLREAFVDLYEEFDVMENFRNDVSPGLSEDKRAELPMVPPKGTLDIQSVKDSDFFFA